MIETENNPLSTLLGEHIESQYQYQAKDKNNSANLHSDKKKSWLGTIRAKVNNLVSKQTEIQNYDVKITKNTVIQETLATILVIGNLICFPPAMIFLSNCLKSLLQFMGGGYLLEPGHKSLIADIVTFLWAIISAGIPFSVSVLICFFTLPWIMEGKIFTGKKRQLIAQKENIINEINQQYEELQEFFTPEITEDILNYFEEHFPGIQHKKGYSYHQSYHILQKSFTTNPVDYKTAMVHIECLYRIIEEINPQDMSDEHKALFNKIRSLI